MSRRVVLDRQSASGLGRRQRLQRSNTFGLRPARPIDQPLKPIKDIGRGEKHRLQLLRLVNPLRIHSAPGLMVHDASHGEKVFTFLFGI